MSSRSLLAVWLAALCAGTANAQQTGGVTDPGVIFDRARAAWRNEGYPALVRYRVVIRFRLGDELTTQTHEALWRHSDGNIFVHAISQEEHASPHEPHGINLPFGLGGHEFAEPFGVPRLGPVYSFGLGARPKAPPLASGRGDETENGPKEIGRVSIVARDYTVELIGTEACDDGAQAYHLGLQPVRKPDAYPLRELWVRNDDYSTCKLRVAHNFAESPVGRGPWEIRFVRSGSMGTTIAEERPLETLTYRGRSILDARISFEDVAAARDDIHTTIWMLNLSSTRGEVTREPDEPRF